MSVFILCEQAVGLVRGKRLILSSTEKSYLEALNYEGLTAEHSQDEAVVCALHFARVRDRLLQIYPWVFARKSATVSAGGSLPSDCMNRLRNRNCHIPPQRYPPESEARPAGLIRRRPARYSGTCSCIRSRLRYAAR